MAAYLTINKTRKGIFMKTNVKNLAFAGIIACLYAILTLVPGLSALSFGPLQLRVAEVLTVLPVFSPWAIAGLSVGCGLSNLASPMMALDLPLGTLATFLAALCTYLLRKKPKLALAMPAIFNGLIIGSIITFFYSDIAAKPLILIGNMLSVAVGEIIVCYALGYPLVKYLKKNNMFNK